MATTTRSMCHISHLVLEMHSEGRRSYLEKIPARAPPLPRNTSGSLKGFCVPSGSIVEKFSNDGRAGPHAGTDGTSVIIDSETRTARPPPSKVYRRKEGFADSGTADLTDKASDTATRAPNLASPARCYMVLHCSQSGGKLVGLPTSPGGSFRTAVISWRLPSFYPSTLFLHPSRACGRLVHGTLRLSAHKQQPVLRYPLCTLFLQCPFMLVSRVWHLTIATILHHPPSDLPAHPPCVCQIMSS